MARANWGKAKHQVLVLRNEIVSLLADGENLERIYQQLIVEHNLNITPRTFQRYAARIRDELCTSLLANNMNQSEPVAGAAKRSVSIPAPTQPGVFNHNSADADKTLEREW